MNLKIKRIGQHNLPLPSYATAGAAGLDLRVRLPPGEESVWLNRGGTFRLPCGFAFSIPEGYEGQVRPRSSASARGLHVALGTIDSDFRGEVVLIITNTSGMDVEVKHGERLAQLVLAPMMRATLEEVQALEETARGARGFGSTGTGAAEVAP